MILKQIMVSARKSKNYQTYEMSETIIIEKDDDVEMVRKESQARCRKACMEQITIDSP